MCPSSFVLPHPRSPGSSAGAAVYLAGPGACLNSVSNTVFTLNGPLGAPAAPGASPGTALSPTAGNSTATNSTTASTASTTFLAGGAIAMDGADGCDIAFDRVAFLSNTAGGQGQGGAVYLGRTDSRAIRMRNCTFAFNVSAAVTWL